MQTSIGRTTLSPGTYYMYATVAATTNYNGATSTVKQFTVKVLTAQEVQYTPANSKFKLNGSTVTNVEQALDYLYAKGDRINDRLNSNNYNSLFYGDTSLQAFNLRKYDIESSSNNVSCNSMFNGCTSLTYADLRGLAPVACANYMFSNCPSLEWVDLRGVDFSGCFAMNYMFKDCSNLEGVYTNDERLINYLEEQGISVLGD